MKHFKWLLCSSLLVLLVACTTPTGNPQPQPQPEPTRCVVSAPPASLGLDPFYTKYCSVRGIPVVSASVVPDAALTEAWKVMDNMLKEVSSSTIQQIIANKTRMGIIGAKQKLTDMPEYKNLDTQFPIPGGWDARARGLGATPFIPLSSGAEENLLCYPTDPYLGENILLHEFAHTVLIMGVQPVNGGFRGRLTNAYNAALAKGLWANTYAATTVDEYWAEGVQDYYNNNIQAIPSNGIHNEINTRAELKTYDPALYDLIAEVFGTHDYTPTCPTP